MVNSMAEYEFMGNLILRQIQINRNIFDKFDRKMFPDKIIEALQMRSSFRGIAVL